MVTNDFLQAEAQQRRRVAIVAGVSAILMLFAPLAPMLLTRPENSDNVLGIALAQSEYPGIAILSSVLSAVSLLLVTVLGLFLLRAVRNRTRVQGFLMPLLAAGGLGLTIFTIVVQIVRVQGLEAWVDDSSLTWYELGRSQTVVALSFVGLVVQFAFAIGLVISVMNAMRIGLLTRFLGYLGLFAGILMVFPIIQRFLPLPIIQAYWLAMMALMLWNVGGAREPPAWASGRVELWPSAAEARDARVRAAEAKRGGRGQVEQVAVEDRQRLADETVDVDPDGDGKDAFGQPAPKRKRKKRR